MSILENFTRYKNMVEAGIKEMEALAVYLEDTRLLPSPTSLHVIRFVWEIESQRDGYSKMTISNYGGGYSFALDHSTKSCLSGSELSFSQVIERIKKHWCNLDRPVVVKGNDHPVTEEELKGALRQLKQQAS